MSIVEAENLSLVATVATFASAHRCERGVSDGPSEDVYQGGPKTGFKPGEMGPAIRAVILSSNSTTRWWLVYQPI